MTKKKPAKLRPDVAEVAHRVYLEAIGEAPKTLPPSERPEKNPEAIKRGRKGGKKGGATRSGSLSAEERHNLAKRAAATRWRKTDD